MSKGFEEELMRQVEYLKSMDEIVNVYVELGRKHGKAPWSCDAYIEMAAYNKLNEGCPPDKPDYQQATMEETIAWD